jgi:hypothetical protein
LINLIIFGEYKSLSYSLGNWGPKRCNSGYDIRLSDLIRCRTTEVDVTDSGLELQV